MKAIFKNEQGKVQLLSAGEGHDVLAVAIKVAPTGHGIKLVEDKDLPEHEFYDHWQVDDSELTDGMGS